MPKTVGGIPLSMLCAYVDRSSVRILLYAFGDVRQPLDETVKVLDEIVTEYEPAQGLLGGGLS